jgi:hypothetical protein
MIHEKGVGRDREEKGEEEREGKRKGEGWVDREVT